MALGTYCFLDLGKILFKRFWNIALKLEKKKAFYKYLEYLKRVSMYTCQIVWFRNFSRFYERKLIYLIP